MTDEVYAADRWSFNRRSVMASGMSLTLVAGCTRVGLLSAPAEKPLEIIDAGQPVVAITQAPDQHWFGYYDKRQIDLSGRFALGARVSPIFRSPQPDDRIEIGLIDLVESNRWRPIGSSTAWSWQQGSMLQWFPGKRRIAVWNDREGDQLVARTYDVDRETTGTLPHPIYTLMPDGREALTLDFFRLQILRPGYGYALKQIPPELPRAPDDEGVWRLDLSTGERRLIISLKDLANDVNGVDQVGWHWVNHLLVDPSGSRFIFLHRWRDELLTGTSGDPGFFDRSNAFATHALTADLDGGRRFLLNDSGYFSHFDWKDPKTIAAFAQVTKGSKQGFFLFRDREGSAEPIDEVAMPHNGHNTYVPGTDQEWIVNDTYPLGAERLQTLYLYHVPTRRKVILGRFPSPPQFDGEWRCDLHPRCDQQGRRVFFDSAHSGLRQMYSISIAPIVGT